LQIIISTSPLVHQPGSMTINNPARMQRPEVLYDLVFTLNLSSSTNFCIPKLSLHYNSHEHLTCIVIKRLTIVAQSPRISNPRRSVSSSLLAKLP
jgi:hypothetical protein